MPYWQMTYIRLLNKGLQKDRLVNPGAKNDITSGKLTALAFPMT
jgi:hypothetical protein